MNKAMMLGAVFAFGLALPLHAHDASHFSAGAPGDPKKPFRTVEVVMNERGEAMEYTPKIVNVSKGEQIKFVLRNEGRLRHEFVLASKADNFKHEAMMAKFPDMEHDDPNGKTLASGARSEILWRFSKAGEFEFACLIPTHRDFGMVGKVVVK